MKSFVSVFQIAIVLFAAFDYVQAHPQPLTPPSPAKTTPSSTSPPHGTKAPTPAPSHGKHPSPAPSNSGSGSSGISFNSTAPRYKVPLQKGKGPVLKGAITLKTIFFGDNFKSFQKDYVPIIQDALAHLSGSKYFTEMVSVAGEAPTIKYNPKSDSGTLGPADMQMINEMNWTSTVESFATVLDFAKNTIYIMITDFTVPLSDSSEQQVRYGGPQGWCGNHFSFKPSLLGVPVNDLMQFVQVGTNSDFCGLKEPFKAKNGKEYVFPNKHKGYIDNAVSAIIHEIAEVITNPEGDQNNPAWYGQLNDKRKTRVENADYCQYTYPAAEIVPGDKNSVYNVKLGNNHFLLQSAYRQTGNSLGTCSADIY